ncbi:YlbG family protein [Facklamia sp. 7083-14-GEN3]|uniref:YlbG family protein n=1 Tax=Facklamia sp. 7083-14-GEN3 TaxID=2973478 RepID=UPI00215CE236|nr:YlbG family protein [Facklamia sp. 7083-14-GEN3]MCR8969253.1 YlbG family protein [Facklamia sp. 7083-14-GEN3]
MTFETVKRKSIVVWLYTLKQWKQLRKYGTVHYLSERLKYAIVYVNDSQIDETLTSLRNLNFVREVEVSYRDDIDMTFKNAIKDRIDPDLKSDEEEDVSFDEFFKDLAQEIVPEAKDNK